MKLFIILSLSGWWLLASFDSRSTFLPDGEKIVWRSNTKLKWDDFKRLPDTTSSYKAMTYVQIGLESKEYTDSIVVNIPCYFYKDLSWSRNKMSASLLQHEQLHFNIAEVVSRRIRKKYSEYRYVDKNKAYDDLQTIYQYHYRKVLDSINSKYDSETNHGIITGKQKQWETTIAAELKALNRYASTKVVVKRAIHH